VIETHDALIVSTYIDDDGDDDSVIIVMVTVMKMTLTTKTPLEI